jgi:hypothetical protein
MDVIGHLKNLNKGPKRKDKLIIETYDNKKTFTVKNRLRENQLTQRSIFAFITCTFSALSILSLFKNIPSPFFASKRVRRTMPEFQNFGITIVYFVFKSRH